MSKSNRSKSVVIGSANTFDHAGKTYTLSKVTLAELRELESYLRSETLESVSHLLGKMEPDVRQVTVAEALKLGESRRIGTKAFNEAVQSLTGTLHLMFLSLRPKHPDLNKDDVARIFHELIEAGVSEEVKSKLHEVAGFDSKKGKAQTTT